MADLNYKFSPDCEMFTWNITGVPSDNTAPGRDNYLVQVHNDYNGEQLLSVPGAEDNLWGVDYQIEVPAGAPIYVFAANDAHSFHWEQDWVVHCEQQTAQTAIPDPSGVDNGALLLNPLTSIILTIVLILRRLFMLW